MVGAILKSKINGALFYVDDLKKEGGSSYYIISELGTDKRVACGKEWFEKGIMQNLEIVEG